MPTERQQQVLDFVLTHERTHGLFPTLREIQTHFGFASPFAVTRHLQALSKTGLLQRQAGKARAFTTPALSRRGALLEIPIYGTIPAGTPVAAEQEAESHITVNAASLGLPSSASLFALRVRGDSMIGAGILSNDVVFLTPRTPTPHAIVAALIDGESTLKRFLVQRGQPFLRAENPAYPDLIPANELVIQGVMVGLLRVQN